MSAQPNSPQRWRWLLVAGAPLLVVVWFALTPRTVDLWVDNGRAVPVEVRVGDATHRVEANETLQLRVAAGFRTLAGPGGVLQADLAANSTGARGTYVWNVDAQASYWTVGRGYGDTPQPKPERFTAPGAVFQLPTDYVPTLNQDLPETVRVKRDEGGTVRHALWSEHYAAQKQPAPSRLVVDNTGMATLEVRVDGEAVGQVAREAIFVLDPLPTGEHTFTAVERGPNGAEGKRFEHTVALAPGAFKPRTYVWAPGNPAPSYALVAQTYGDVAEVPATSPFQASGSWFVLPADLYSVNAFPETADPALGAKGAVVRSLWTRRAYDAYLLKPKLKKFAEGIQPTSMGELGEKLMQRQAAEAEAAAKAVEETEHDHAHEAPPAPEPGELDPEQLFPPR